MNPADLKKIKSGFVKTDNQHQAGIACLASVIKYYGGNVEMQRLYANSGAATNGINLAGLCAAARVDDFKANGFKANVEAVKQIVNPAILHVSKGSGGNDFIVLYGWHENKFIIGDPQWGIVEYREDELEAVWKSKTLMLLEPNSTFKTAKEKARLKRNWFSELIKNQKKVFFVLGFLGFIQSVLLVTLFLSVTKKAAEIVDVVGSKQFIIYSSLYLLIMFLLLAIKHITNILEALGTKSFTSEMNHLISENIFKRKSFDRELLEAGANALLNAASKFSNFAFLLSSNVSFYITLFVVSDLIITLYFFWAGFILFIAIASFACFFWSDSKKVKQQYNFGFKAELQKNESLHTGSRFLQLIKLSNSEEFYTQETIHILDFSPEAGFELAKLQNRWRNQVTIGGVLVTFLVVAAFFNFYGINAQLSWLPVLFWLIINIWTVNEITSLAHAFWGANSLFTILYNNLNTDFSPDTEKKTESELQIPFKILSVQKLGFAFPGRPPVFQDLDLAFEQRKINIVFGKSGSGKSVLMSILNRMLPMGNGAIEIDDINWEECDDVQWRNNIASVLQPVQLFNKSILENIGWGKVPIEQQKIVSFCEKFEFDKFFRELPNGYATSINNLSAGYVQIVSFAAALYRNPRILFLDEPFAFLDEEMENFCLQLLKKLKNEMVIIIFTGKNSIKSVADTVFCL
jgi:ATP-binding cassette, subfamily C, bacteriocin exporter